MAKSSIEENKIVGYLKGINWSYRWQKLKDNIFYIFAFMFLVTIPWLPDWPLIGPFYRDIQAIGILPNDPSVALLLTQCTIFAIFVVSWDLLSGYSGQVSFGHAIFFGLGAYLTIIIKTTGIHLKFLFFNIDRDYDNNIREIAGIPINFGLIQVIIVSAIIISIFAVFVGVLTLRSKGPYFALLTLVIPLIAQELITNDAIKDISGGEGGKTLPNSQWIVPIGDNTYTELLEVQFKVILVVGIISIGIMYMIAKSRIGIVFQSIREDELAASASGINVNFYKLLAMSISAFFAAIAGGLTPHIFNSATPSLFDPERSFEAIIFSIVGGIGTITGAVVATFFFITVLQLFLSDAFIDTPTIEVLALAVLLIVILKFQPGGLVRAASRLRNAFIIALLWTISFLFYDATDDGFIYSQTTTGLILEKVTLKSRVGDIFERIHWVQTPEDFLVNQFGEEGFLGINVAVVEGRILIYFLVGLIFGYYGPELIKKIRLRLWGVWPSLGKYEPPN